MFGFAGSVTAPVPVLPTLALSPLLFRADPNVLVIEGRLESTRRDEAGVGDGAGAMLRCGSGCGG